MTGLENEINWGLMVSGAGSLMKESKGKKFPSSTFPALLRPPTHSIDWLTLRYNHSLIIRYYMSIIELSKCVCLYDFREAAKLKLPKAAF